jgi:carbonic anhydrase/acetyltransferase-like protein (isoleucine patch superfamily)
VADLMDFEGKAPRIDPAAFVARGAQLIGDVEIGPESSVWYNCVLRADMNRIRIGARSNVQDGSIIHVDPPRPGGPAEGFPCLIGDDVLIGHVAMIHGCILEDRAFVGLGSIVMDGCVVEGDAMLAAGALLTPGKRVRTGQLWAGRPARFVRDLSAEDIAGMRMGAAHYVALAKRHAAAFSGR